MAKLSCANLTSDQNNYSAPVPVIGLYIAAATMVCSVLIICDVICGIRRRKLWFPCRFFSLNSVTLTLLSIAAKLPVDLTTSMPSGLDQLSKLTGTALICISMAFLYPSVGDSRHYESLTNMASLSILVITVIVNICIQMSTRVIFSFILEHVIIMFFMLSLLFLSWGTTLVSKDETEKYMDENKDIFVRGSQSMLHRLKELYILGYNINPQFVLCQTTFSSLTNFISLICLTLVLQAMLRSGIPNESRCFNGTSDYGWSRNLIIATQILFILVGGSASSFRQFILWPVQKDCYLPDNCNDWLGKLGSIWSEVRHPFLSSIEKHQCLYIAVKSVGYSLHFIMISVLHTISSFVCLVFCSCFHILICGSRDIEPVEEYRHLQFVPEVHKWTLMKCVQDMKILKGSNESSSIRSLIQILSKPPLSEQSFGQLHNRLSREGRNEVSCLDMVIVVRIASVSMPSGLNSSLTPILREIFDVIHFVDTKMHCSKLENRRKCKLAKDLWMGEDLSKVLPKILIGSTNEPCQPQSDLDRARLIIRGLESVMFPSDARAEFVRIIFLIEDREYTSIEELYDYMEQIFVYRLCVSLPQLPEAIFKEVSNSSIAELDEKVRYMLKLLWKIESLEEKFQWSYPAGSNITRLITETSDASDSGASEDNSTTAGGNVSDTNVIEDVDHNNVPDAHLDEIIVG